MEMDRKRIAGQKRILREAAKDYRKVEPIGGFLLLAPFYRRCTVGGTGILSRTFLAHFFLYISGKSL